MAEAAFIGGKPATLDEAIAAAAARLGASRSPLICGLATDAAGAAAAVRLAGKIDASLDHQHAAAALRDLDAMREGGWIVTTPLQTRARADLVLLAGRGLGAAWPSMEADLALDRAPMLATERTRSLWRLGTEAGAREHQAVTASPDELAATIGALRAIIGGRPTTLAAARAKTLGALAEALRAASYGVIVWSASGLGWAGVEMLTGLVDDLNETTRFAGLPLPAGENAAGVVHTLAALTGLPLRLGFIDGAARHDPWQFDPRRLAAAGETDQILWIGAAGSAPPDWAGRVPMIVLQPGASGGRRDVAIAVGASGVDHGGAVFATQLGAVVWKEAEAASDAPSVAAILDRITALC